VTNAGSAIRIRALKVVLVGAIALAGVFFVSRVVGGDRPQLAGTSLYTRLAAGCVEVALAGWKHPAKAVFDREAKSVRRLQLCYASKYPIFFTELRYDPSLGHNDGYLFKLVGDVFTANGCSAFSIVDTLDNVVIEVRTKGDKAWALSLEEYQN
jgi:hypothetical protein